MILNSAVECQSFEAPKMPRFLTQFFCGSNGSIVRVIDARLFCSFLMTHLLHSAAVIVRLYLFCCKVLFET